MSGNDFFVKLGLRECKACVDIKHKQWFPAADSLGQGVSKCLVCATEEGMEAINHEASRGDVSGKRQACSIIQEQIEGRLKWAANVRKQSHEQARKMEKIAASAYRKLGEAGREIAGLAKLKTKNQLFLCELESTQWQEVHSGAEEEDVEEVEEQKKGKESRWRPRKKPRNERNNRRIQQGRGRLWKK